jgi:hypothetical protein
MRREQARKPNWVDSCAAGIGFRVGLQSAGGRLAFCPCTTLALLFVNPRRLLCVLGLHRYLYAGVVLGQRLERCKRCQKTRALSQQH